MMGVMLNRRGFISSLAGLVAWAKSGNVKSISPAASAIQPTCENTMESAWVENSSNVIDRVSLASGDAAWVNNCNGFQVGQPVDVYRHTGVLRGTAVISSICEAKDIVHLSWNIMPQAGDYLVVHGGSSPRLNPATPYFRISGDAGAYMGLKRSVSVLRTLS